MEAAESYDEWLRAAAALDEIQAPHPGPALASPAPPSPPPVDPRPCSHQATHAGELLHLRRRTAQRLRRRQAPLGRLHHRLRAGLQGTLADMCAGRRAGRAAPDEITLFKSVGTALADLAAAVLVHRGSGPALPP